MCPQPRPARQRDLGIPSALAADKLAADQAWIAKCIADRRRSLAEAGTLYTYRASLSGFSTSAI